MTDFHKLADLIRKRNAIGKEITALIGRPAQIGHIGEHIASEVFDIALQESAVNKGFDGRFRSGPLTGRSVNIKWYAKREGLLDLRPDALPDYYLVMTGPRATILTSRGEARPLLIEQVFLFEARRLLAQLEGRKVKTGVATSITRDQWEAAEIYPSQKSSLLPVSDAQRALLKMFGADASAPR